jgi:serine/threonine-protein kinase
MLTWTPARWKRASTLIDDALARPKAERKAFLRAACPDDDALRTEVEAMLALQVDDHPLLDADAAHVGAPLVVHAEDTDRTDATVERYRLVRSLGRGGMGVVYLAERADGQFQQQVALKLLTRAAPEAVRRFRAERQILAALNHPGVAQLLDGGVAEPTPAQPDGVPFLVMEYVDGEPITDYARRRRLVVEDCLRLVLDVAEAVQHAHRKLVIHRDLKPSNILVAEGDAGQPQVKLLDFGIAKLLDREALAPGLTAVTTATGLGLMTPAYAAPEQVTGAPCDVTTDVYQLGVVLYELLTGTLPFDLDGATPTEAARTICETDPAPPSEAAARANDQETQTRGRTLRGDLDTLVLKALRKVPARRYASMEAFADDVRRYLDGRPLAARPDSTAYRLRLFARRHRGPLVVAVVIAALLVVLGVRERTLRVEAEAARAAAVAERERAEQEASKAEQVSSFLTGLFEAADPERAQGEAVTARELLNQGLARVDKLQASPVVQAQMLHTIGNIHRRLDHFEEAERALGRALEIRESHFDAGHPDLIASYQTLGLLLRDREQMAAADTLLGLAVKSQKARVGPNHEDVATALMRWAYVQRRLEKLEQAEASIREAIAIQTALYDGPHMGTAESLFNLAAILRDRGNTNDALTAQHRSLAMARALTEGPHPGVAANLNNLSILYEMQEDWEEAAALCAEAVAMNKQLYGERHSETATAIANLGDIRRQQGRYAEADSLLQEALDIRISVYGPSHTRVAETLRSMGNLSRLRQRFAEAESLLQRTLRINRDELGPAHPRVIGTLRDLGELARQRGDDEQAQRYIQEARALQRQGAL